MSNIRYYLGVDPGSKNFSIGLISETAHFAAWFFLENVLNTITGDTTNVIEHFKELKNIIKQYKPIRLVTERYQSRGFANPSIELCSFSNGIIFSLCQKTMLISSSHWKNQINQLSDLKLIYKKFKLPTHVIDSICIAEFSRKNGKYDKESISLLIKIFGKLQLSYVKKSLHGECYLSSIR